MSQQRVVAIALLTQQDLDNLGVSLRNVIPVLEDAAFDDILTQLDRVEVEQFGRGIILRPERRS